MNPHKSSESYGEISKQTGISEKDIQTINTFYWKTMRSALSDLVNPNISVIGLGEMNIKHWSIPEKIRELTAKKNYWGNKSTETPIFKTYMTDLAKVENMQNMIEREKEKKMENQEKRKEYELNQSLEKQESNN